MASYVPDLHAYGLLADLGDSLARQNAARDEAEKTLWQQATAAKFGAGVPLESLPPAPQPRSMFQRLVGTVTGEPSAPAMPAAPAPAAEPTPKIEMAAFGVPETLWKAQIGQESGGKQFNADGTPKTSSKGAVGIAQVMPGTAPVAAQLAGVPFDEKRYRTDPTYNETLGRAYMGEQMRSFGDPVKALAAYNAGPERVKNAIAARGADWLSSMPAETKDYVARITGAAGAVPATASAEATTIPAAMKAFPASLRTMEGIQAAYATGNPYIKQFADKALDTLTRKDVAKDFETWTPVDASKPVGPGSLIKSSRGEYKVVGGATAQGQPHVVGNALVSPTGEVLYRGTEKGTGTLSKDAIDTMAERGLQGDESWITGLGRGAQGAQNIVDVRNRQAELLKERGGAPQDILNNVARYGGLKAGARTAGQMAKKLDILGGTVASASDYATKLSNEFPRGNFVPFNQLKQMALTSTSDPKLAAFKASVNTLINEYARAIGGGVGTDASREHAREMLGTAQSPEAFSAVTGVLQREVKIAHDSALTELNKGAGMGKASPAEAATPALGSKPVPPAAVNHLKANPALRDDFDQNYGSGASDLILGPRR